MVRTVVAALIASVGAEEARYKLHIDKLRPEQRGGSLAHDRFEDKLKGYTSSQSKSLTVPLDHFNSSDDRSFAIRYYTDSSYFDGSGPIFLQMGCEGPVGGVRCDSRAKQFNALCVAYEHRYYGKSLPWGGLASENLPFLTVEQNLADAALLVDTLRENLGDNSRSVISTGGSYCGATCAWFRTRYPSKSNGCVSESGVVNAILNFTAFDSHVYNALHSYDPSCAAAVQESTRAMERLFAQGRKEYVKSVFGASSLNNPTFGDTDFYYMIADQVAMMDQYGAKASLCEGLKSLPSSPSDEQRLENLNEVVTNHYGPGYAGDCFYNSDCVRNNGPDAVMRSWRWQKCLELAYLQPAPASESLRASALTLDALIAQCQYMFPEIAPAKPDTEGFDAKFGGAVPAFEGELASNIIFLDYSDDPWLEASPMKENPGMPYCRTTCDGCGHCGAGAPYSKRQHCQDVATQSVAEWLGSSAVV
jgi:hypothetical protein